MYILNDFLQCNFLNGLIYLLNSVGEKKRYFLWNTKLNYANLHAELFWLALKHFFFARTKLLKKSNESKMFTLLSKLNL